METLTTPNGPDFRSFLQETLIARCRSNPRYSLRSFARALGIEPSLLSKLLNGKRRPTAKMIDRLGLKLGLDPQKLRSLRNDATPTSQVGRDFERLTLDSFQVIADWYHYAILELLRIPGTACDTKAVARRLGVTVHEARAAIERLIRLEMIAPVPTFETDPTANRWMVTSGNHTTVGNAFTATAFRRLQKQILEQALVALEEIPLEERDQSSMTVAFDSALLPEAKTRIREFRRGLTNFLESQGKPDAVFQFSISLFPVTRKQIISTMKGKRNHA